MDPALSTVLGFCRDKTEAYQGDSGNIVPGVGIFGFVLRQDRECEPLPGGAFAETGVFSDASPDGPGVSSTSSVSAHSPFSS